MSYSDEALELAAQSAENWRKHGHLDCAGNWTNADGFP